MVFCPLAREELRSLATGSTFGPRAAFAVTPSFRSTFGLSEADEEDAERTALYVAALAGLLSNGVRLVAVAEASATDERGELGQVSVDELRFSRVTALFADDPRNANRVATTLLDLSGSELPDAWDAPEHERLLAETDLLWHGPEEWSNLT